MRELTFKGYLLSQLQELSELKTTSMYSFSKSALNNARLRDVLVMYLVLYTDDNLKNKLLKKFSYLVSPCERLYGLTQDNVSVFLNCDNLSEYKTVYDNFVYQRDHKKQDDKIKLMMYSRICELKQLKEISNYRIYKELALNHGNINAFLKNGDVSKVGLDTVRKILEFVNSYKSNRTA